jgi:hypothetical protein
MGLPTTIQQSGRAATGIQVPDQIVQALGSGRRPAVTVTINGYTHRSTVARWGCPWSGSAPSTGPGTGPPSPFHRVATAA